MIDDLLRKCNLPISAAHLKLKDYTNGDKLITYLRGPDFANDCKHGNGLYFTGTSKTRLPMFMAFAKALVRMQDSVHYTTLSQLAVTLMDGDTTPAASMSSALFISGFYCDKSDCPLTLAQKFEIIRFLETRLCTTKRTYLSLPTPLSSANKWWGTDFIDSIELRTKEVICGRI